jgi:hypothetical protein
MQHVAYEPGALGQIVRLPIGALAAVEDIVLPEDVAIEDLPRGNRIELIVR